MDKHEENALLLCLTGVSVGALIFIAIYQIPAMILLAIVAGVIYLFSYLYGGIYFLSGQYDRDKAIEAIYNAEQEKRKMDFEESTKYSKTLRKSAVITMDEIPIGKEF